MSAQFRMGCLLAIIMGFVFAEAWELGAGIIAGFFIAAMFKPRLFCLVGAHETVIVWDRDGPPDIVPDSHLACKRRGCRWRDPAF